MKPHILLRSLLFSILLASGAYAQTASNSDQGSASVYVPKVRTVSLGQISLNSQASFVAPKVKPIDINSCDLDHDPIENQKTNLVQATQALSHKTEDQFVKDSWPYIDVRVREPWAIDRRVGQTETLFPGNSNCGVVYPPAEKDDLQLVVQNDYTSPTIAGQDRSRSYNDMPTSYRVCKVSEEGNRTVIYLKTNAYAKECDVRSFNLFCEKKDGRPTTIADFNEGTNAGFLRMGYKLH